MALFKQDYTTAIPAHAERITHKGQPAVRFKGRGGKVVTALLTADGKKCRRESAKWYGEYVDADGLLQRVALSPLRAVAEQMLAERKRKAELVKGGLVDPYEDHRKRPLNDHLSDWERDLHARGNTAKDVKMQMSRVRKLVTACTFRKMSDLSASAVQAHLA
jgi:hypothetical protein